MASITPYINNSMLFTLFSEGNSSEETISMITVAPIAFAVGLLTVFTILGNLLTIIAVVIESKLHKFENYFFASLAVADLSIAIVVMPMHLRVEVNRGNWYSSDFACDLFIFTDVTCCTASILNLCAIALNRYWSISSPLKYATKQTTTRAGITISVVWILSLIIASPPLFGWPTRLRREYTCMYDTDHYYVIYSSFGSFFIPLLLLNIVYYKIFGLAKQGARFRRAASSYNLPKRNASTSSGCYMVGRVTMSSDVNKKIDGREGWGKKTLRKLHVRRPLSKADRAEMKTVKTLGVIMGTFIACWLPFFSLYLITPFCAACKVPPVVDRFALWLGYTNSLLNPIIYICCKSLFRKTFKKIICLNYCRSNKRYKLSNRRQRGMYKHIPRRNCDGDEDRLKELQENKIDDEIQDDISEGKLDTYSKNTSSKLSCSPSSWSARKERFKQVTLNLVPQVRKLSSSWRSRDSLDIQEGRTIMTSFVTEIDHFSLSDDPDTNLSKSDSHLHRCGVTNSSYDASIGITETEVHLPPRMFLPRVHSFPNMSSEKINGFCKLPLSNMDKTYLSVPKNAPFENNFVMGFRLSDDVQEIVDQDDPHGIQLIITDANAEHTCAQENPSKDINKYTNTEDQSTSIIPDIHKNNCHATKEITDIESQHIDTLIDCSNSDSTTDSQISEEDFLRGKVKENICRRHIESEDCIKCRRHRFVIIKEVGVQTDETPFNETTDLPYLSVHLEDKIPDLIASARLSENQAGTKHQSNSTRSSADDKPRSSAFGKVMSSSSYNDFDISLCNEHTTDANIISSSRSANFKELQSDESLEPSDYMKENVFCSRFDPKSLNVLVHCRSSDL
ncbi:alpha-1A adrenergic receptor-like [Anneissia japonica]|uniref:alpha-1A adrenergic receptor-like n=1 Tax=Anneissia japonica TaxID=1529436 RepID=UPI001425A4FE|nr:alpha-1A adrenergic receptor-like [Anneissia japonica]XP_033102153.1 alpha-1A adrenergic receptor-like [Anneissia japonica]